MKKNLPVFSGIFVGALLIVLIGIFVLGGNITASDYVSPCDIGESFAKNEIDLLCKDGVLEYFVRGDKTYFYPESGVTREYMARAMVKYLGIDEKKYNDYKLPVSDADMISEQYLPYVRAAVARGLFPLYADGSEYRFAPTEGVSREEASYIASALCSSYISSSKAESFPDFEDTNEAFRAAMKRVVAYGIIIGYPDGTLRPQNIISHEELALMLSRMRENKNFISELK